MTNLNSNALNGIKVIDFSELLPGPFFTQNLLELGAEVIKIERPPHGDNARSLYPGMFEAVNRGKQSILLDLKTSEGLSTATDLIKDADILVEGYRPGVMNRLGLDYQKVHELNPKIIYVSLSGYGQTGSYSHLPGHDLNYLSVAGALAIGGSDPQNPAPGAGLPVADLAGSMYALSSCLAALFSRVASGKGQYLDVSLTDCVMHWINPRIGAFFANQQLTLDEQRHEILNKPAYGCFKTSDSKHIVIAALENHFWGKLKNVLKLGHYDFNDNDYNLRAQNAIKINTDIGNKISTYTEKSAIELLQNADLPVSQLVLPTELDQSTHAIERNLFTEKNNYSNYIKYPVKIS